MNLDLNYLRYFYFVAKENGFTRAAAVLNVQQPVVSRAVKLLEKDLGSHLLERQRKNIILTKSGELVFAECQKIFGTLSQLEERFVSTKGHGQKLSIACSDSLSYGLIESLYSVFRKSNPQFVFTHQSGSASLFLSEIESGKIDLGIFFNVPLLARNLVKSKMSEIDFHYVVKANLRDNRDVLNSFIGTLNQLEQSPEDLPLFKKYKSYNNKASITFVSNSTMTRKACVQKGQGVSILPEFLIRDELRKGSMVSLYKPEKLVLHLIERQSSYRSELKNQLVSEVKKFTQFAE
jgi:DNA-binding transcriptional LysR family regulator